MKRPGFANTAIMLIVFFTLGACLQTLAQKTATLTGKLIDKENHQPVAEIPVAQIFCENQVSKR